MNRGKPTAGRIFWGISSFEIMAMFRRGLFYSFLSIYLRHYLGMSVTETTLFATLPMVLNITFQTFVWGPLSDRLQRRRTLIVCGELLAAVGTVGVWYAHTLPRLPQTAGYFIIVGLSVIEIFWSMSNIGWSAMISDIYNPTERSTIQGRLASLGGVGRIVGVWIGGLLYDGLGLRYSGWGFHSGILFFAAAAAMVVSVIPMLGLPEGGVPTAARRGTIDRFPKAATAVFGLFIAAMTLINFGRNSVALIQSQYLVLETGFAVSSRVLSYIVNTQSLAMVLTGLTAGRLTGRFGDRCGILFGGGLAIVSLVLFAHTDLLWLIYLGSFMRGCADVIILTASYSLASVLIPADRRARWFSIYNATLFLSWGLGATLMAGPIVDGCIAAGIGETGAYRAAFWAAGIVTLAGIILMALRVRPSSPDASEP